MLKPPKQLRKTSCSLTTLLLVLVFTFVLSGCGGSGGSARMDTDMMPGTGDDTDMMPGTGDGTGMMPGMGDGTGGGETPMKPPTPMPYFVDGLVANPSPSVFANSAEDTLGTLQPQGQEFGPLTAALLRDFSRGPDRGVSAPEQEDDTYLKTVSSDGAGGFHATYVIGGEEVPFHFTSAELDGREFHLERDDGYIAELWSIDDSFRRDPNDAGNPGYSYLDAVGWSFSTLDRNWIGGYSVYGVRTTPENLPATGAATYDGDVRIRSYDVDDPYSGTGRTRVDGVLKLEANFQDSEITGTINGLRYRAPGESQYAPWPGNSMAISGGEIEGSRFTADWAGEDTDANSADEDSIRGFSGNMLGEFYGPAAEEVGGVLNGGRDATATSTEQLLHGLFFGQKRFVGGVYDSTEAFTSDHAASLELEYSGADIGVRTPEQGEAYVKTIARDGEGGFNVTYVVNNVESNIHLDAGLNTLAKVEGDKRFLFFPYSSKDLNYVEITGWVHDLNDSAGDLIKKYRGLNIHGIATENMPTTGSATYVGRIAADGWDVNEPVANAGRTRLRGDLMLEANFGSSEISGRFDGLQIRGPGESQYNALGSGNSFDISNGAIAGSGFTADWTGVDTDANSAPVDSARGFSGAINGGFYGPAAEEVSGVLSGSRAATATTPEQLIVGGFGGKKMP